MKFKKLKMLFKAIETISRYDAKEVHRASSFYFVKGLNGVVKKPIIALFTSGKYCLPETYTICKILRSIEPVKLSKEVSNINKHAGFELLSLLNGTEENRKYLMVNTALGVICLDVTINDV